MFSIKTETESAYALFTISKVAESTGPVPGARLTLSELKRIIREVSPLLILLKSAENSAVLAVVATETKLK